MMMVIFMINYDKNYQMKKYFASGYFANDNVILTPGIRLFMSSYSSSSITMMVPPLTRTISTGKCAIQSSLVCLVTVARSGEGTRGMSRKSRHPEVGSYLNRLLLSLPQPKLSCFLLQLHWHCSSDPKKLLQVILGVGLSLSKCAKLLSLEALDRAPDVTKI